MKLISVKATAPMIGKTYRSLAKLITEKQWEKMPPVYKIGTKYFFEESEVTNWVVGKRCS